MTRAAFIQRIENLSEHEFERVAPFLQADLDAAGVDLLEDDTPALLRAVECGRESARSEPLLDEDTVFAMARDRSRRA